MAAFSDLNVLAGKDEYSTFEILRASNKLNYQVVAINNHVGELTGKSKKGNPIQIKKPDQIIVNERHLAELKKSSGKGIRQLSRLTTTIYDTAQTHKLQTQEIQAYDLIAVEPTSEKTFHLACGTLEVDIISLDFSQKMSFFIRRPSVSLALERGIHFEIQYSPAIIDSSNRRNVISNALSLNAICKGKNIIISSGCKKEIDLRGPYDVINLGLLFGLTQNQAKDAISKNCRAVLFHAESRKAEKSTISVIKASTLSVENLYSQSLQADEPSVKKRKTEIT